MLKGEISKEVQKRLGFSDEEFTQFIDAVKAEEEKEIKLSEMHVFTPVEFDAFKKKQKELKSKAWTEEEIKLLRQANGWELKSDSIESVLEYGKSLGISEGSKKPDERFNELKGKYDLALKEIDTYKNQVSEKENQLFRTIVKSDLLSELKFDTSIKPEQIFTLYTTEFEPVKDEGFTRVKKIGASDILVDDRFNKIDAKNHFLQYAESFKATGTITKPGDKNFDPKNPTFKTKADYDKWRQESKPDEKTSGQVWLNSLKENPEIANT